MMMMVKFTVACLLAKYIATMALLFPQSVADLPVIPDLEAVQEEDLTTQIAAPPS